MSCTNQNPSADKTILDFLIGQNHNEYRIVSKMRQKCVLTLAAVLTQKTVLSLALHANMSQRILGTYPFALMRKGKTQNLFQNWLLDDGL